MAKTFSKRLSRQTPVWPLLILRVGLGYWFLKFGYAKFPGMFASGKLASQLTDLVKDMPSGWYPWYHYLLVNYLIPHANLLSYLVVYGEIAAGIALIIGFMTRPALFAALIMNLNYHFASGYRHGASGFVNLVFVCAELALLFTPVGRCFGIDYFLNKKYPRSLFFI